MHLFAGARLTGSHLFFTRLPHALSPSAELVRSIFCPGGHQCTHNGLCPIEQVAGVLFAPKGAIALLAAMRYKAFLPRPTLLISGPLRCES